MSQTSDEKNDESAKNAALKENISEDIQQLEFISICKKLNSDAHQEDSRQ